MRERSSVFLISRSLAALPGGGGWRGGEGRGSGSLLHLTCFFLRAVGGCVSKHRKQGRSHPKCNSRLEALAVMNSSLVTQQGQRYTGHPTRPPKPLLVVAGRSGDAVLPWGSRATHTPQLLARLHMAVPFSCSRRQENYTLSSPKNCAMRQQVTLPAAVCSCQYVERKVAALLRGKPFTITCLYIFFSLLKSTLSYVHSIHSKFVFFSISRWEVISPCLQGSERRSLLRPTGISQFNSNVPKPSYMMHGSRSTFLHINYNSDLKILQLNTAVSNEGFTSSDKQQETHSPWVQHNSEHVPGPWWTTIALQWFPMQLVLIVTPWQFHRGPISFF